MIQRNEQTNGKKKLEEKDSTKSGCIRNRNVNRQNAHARTRRRCKKRDENTQPYLRGIRKKSEWLQVQGLYYLVIIISWSRSWCCWCLSFMDACVEKGVFLSFEIILQLLTTNTVAFIGCATNLVKLLSWLDFFFFYCTLFSAPFHDTRQKEREKKSWAHDKWCVLNFFVCTCSVIIC